MKKAAKNKEIMKLKNQRKKYKSDFSEDFKPKLQL